MLPQEIELWIVIPTIRNEIAKEMVREGLTQSETARKLGLTRAAVSNYIKKKRGKEIIFNKKIKEEIRKSAGKITGNESNLMKETIRICDLIRKERIICSLHKCHDYELEKCNLCYGGIK